MLVKPLQALNAESPIEVTLLPMVTLVKPLQPRKAAEPIVVTPLPIVTLVSPLQSSNAELPIEVTLPSEGITLSLHPKISILFLLSIRHLFIFL